jgi:hypothetical protein
LLIERVMRRNLVWRAGGNFSDFARLRADVAVPRAVDHALLKEML